jgi:hypothetical protein
MSDTRALDSDRLRFVPTFLEPPQPPQSAPKKDPPPPAATTSGPGLAPTAIAAVKGQAFAAQLAEKNESFFDAANAAYSVPSADGGKTTVHAAPQFRMVGGFNYHTREIKTAEGKKQTVCVDGPPLVKALAPVTPALTAAVNRVITGRGTPEDVRLVTQTLIDRGKLGPLEPGHEAEAIQAMQWKYGIGMDCAGYVQRAFFAARGRTGTPAERAALGLCENAVNEGFSGLPTNPKFKSVPVAEARAGDLLLLGPPEGGSVGHVVLVQSNTPLSPLQTAKLGVAKGTLTGPVRRVEVDSSWGAGESGTHGGVQRRTWLYDEGTGRWASWDPATKAVDFSSTKGPYEHPLTGIYRPKSEP